MQCQLKVSDKSEVRHFRFEFLLNSVMSYIYLGSVLLEFVQLKVCWHITLIGKTTLTKAVGALLVTSCGIVYRTLYIRRAVHFKLNPGESILYFHAFLGKLVTYLRWHFFSNSVKRVWVSIYCFNLTENIRINFQPSFAAGTKFFNTALLCSFKSLIITVQIRQ